MEAKTYRNCFELLLQADDLFWVQTSDGKALGEDVSGVADRLMEFVQFCMPTESDLCQKKFCRTCGNLCIRVDNSSVCTSLSLRVLNASTECQQPYFVDTNL